MRPLLLLLCLGLTACDAAPPPKVDIEPPATVLPVSVKELSPTEADQWLTSHPEALILDMRMPEEITREGRIEGSKNYDFLQSKTLEQLGAFDRQKPALLYCALGGRAAKASVQLHEMGFSQIIVLKGGMNAWLKEGRPVAK